MSSDPDRTGAVTGEIEVRLMASVELSVAVRAQLRSMLWESFPDEFTEDDWQHGLGGVHVVAFDSERPVGHASIITRTLYVADQRFDGGYLEAVAVDPRYRERGIASSVVRMANQVVTRQYPIAALSTNRRAFYQSLGWERWQGPAYVVAGKEWRRTVDEDDGIMVLRTPDCPVADLTVPIAVEERSGDDW